MLLLELFSHQVYYTIETVQFKVMIVELCVRNFEHKADLYTLIDKSSSEQRLRFSRHVSVY